MVIRLHHETHTQNVRYFQHYKYKSVTYTSAGGVGARANLIIHFPQRRTNLREADTLQWGNPHKLKLGVRHPWEGCLFGKMWTSC